MTSHPSSRLRVIHSSDWHLGHTLNQWSRDSEHEVFLGWLLEQLVDTRADALLVSGDIFDGMSPTLAVLTRWYRFLVELRQRAPALTVVAIGGNHDSGVRLEMTDPLHGAIGAHIIGALSEEDLASLASDEASPSSRLLIPLRRADGAVAAQVCAVPFLHPRDLSWAARAAAQGQEAPQDPRGELVRGLRWIYQRGLRQALSPGSGVARIALGHMYMVNSTASEQSERRLFVGHQEGVPVEVFDGDWSYVALGHLHRPQTVGGREHIRYCGSPLPPVTPEFTV